MRKLNSALAVLIGSVATADIVKGADTNQPVEEIFVVRSLRLSRDKPTSNCAEAKIGFSNVRFEDRYNFQSVTMDEKTGKLTDANVATVGELLACFGPSSSDPMITNFYAEGRFGAVTYTGTGECRTAKKDYPEPGLNMIRCFLDISNLPAEYVGGHLTTNTVTSRRTLGLISEPPGYVQPSIATIRLWKKRAPTPN